MWKSELALEAILLFLYAKIAPAVAIFCYHKITPRLDFGICTRLPGDFQQDVQWLASLPSALRPEITFDDGYEDTYQVAFPILASFGLRATVFVITDAIGKRNDWDANFFGAFRHLSLSELRALSVAGWEIGSHGVSHRALTTLSLAALRRELLCSKQYLEDALGKPVKRISFPFGLFDRRTVEMCQEVGYESAVSIRRASSCGFVQRSLAVYRFDTLFQLRAKLEGRKWELLRLRTISAFSGLTVLMHQLQSVRVLNDVG
ncbi:MAG: polysaccharide deacetylase family protein [Chloroherpetonaceae bacterium]|nr:polysaccharide deacetylase family protein [Chloroherpetonaceae bacterium]MDW8019094.1 polysaccharide deacetylase family protein [Chloroherpetonaceae bacterium]